MQIEIIKVTGMTCNGCISVVKKTLKAIHGVKDVNVSLSLAEAVVQFDETLISPEQWKFAIIEAGYGVGTSNATQKAQGRR